MRRRKPNMDNKFFRFVKENWDEIDALIKSFVEFCKEFIKKIQAQ